MMVILNIIASAMMIYGGWFYPSKSSAFWYSATRNGKIAFVIILAGNLLMVLRWFILLFI